MTNTNETNEKKAEELRTKQKKRENFGENRPTEKTQVLKPDEFPYLFPFHLALESASLKVYY